MASLLGASLRGTSYLIGLQLVSRVLTFSLNTLILRYTSPSVFGFATIQLELLLNTILFLCREGFRLSVQRLPSVGDEKAQQQTKQEIINLSCIPVVLGLFLSSATTSAFLTYAPEESLSIPYFRRTVILYGVATMLELLSEPAYNLALHSLAFKRRAACEGIAVFVRCIVTFASAFSARSYNMGALPFAYGQLAYAITLVMAYLFATQNSLLPKTSQPGRWFDTSSLRFAITSTMQGILKHFLTEGDKVLLSWFSSNAEQGTYGLAANYGGLVARIILQPIEEASRSFFGQLNGRSKENKEIDKKQTQASKNAFVALLSLYAVISALTVSIVPRIMAVALPWFLGKSSRWSNITPVLVAYVYYLPFLAANGVLEAFFAATATAADLKRQSFAWLGFSVLYGIAGYTFSSWGASGLVAANAFNLALRIVYAWQYARGYFLERKDSLAMTEVLPHPMTCSVCALGSALVRVISLSSEASAREFLSYLFRVGALGLAMLSTTIFIERKRFAAYYSATKI
ncbi:Rft protein-domain-containing protein [Protomyces lactucae-debilis]|uniref:Man(5)GlcNAc(2)-PP-dolichol translocation protein RFT1 n=1 Tax=Protomyces lactucae-debilis TaxID=2754530 RepID=A0A1Y2FMG4_PROLT|nr:Rft protein-domain-containing protein [Protomyces lactucae-debilis]ORY84416.1 Rft protein-domain-containing protein [Protomyces lactucae-debilis]